MVGCASQRFKRLERLKEAYPFGLIGDDYEILNKDDLAINTCYAYEAKPFSLNGDTDYPYWKCYSTHDVSLRCDDPDYDEDEKALMVILALEVRSKNDGNHDYLPPRAIRLDLCQHFQNEFNKVTEKESHICISGDYWEKYEDDDGSSVMTWSFDKFKTKKGCVSYFAGQCDLKVQLERGCKPKAK